MALRLTRTLGISTPAQAHVHATVLTTLRMTPFFVVLPAAVVASLWPSIAIVVMAILAVAALVLLERLRDRLLFAASVTILLGYLLFGRGFAYIGAPPVYVGEVLLLLAITALIGHASDLRWNHQTILLTAFLVVGFARTVPFLGEFQVAALRDAAVWGYAIIALAIAASMRPGHFTHLSSVYEKLLPIIVVSIPSIAIIYYFARTSLPIWPGAPVPLGSFKGGDAAVHLAGAAAFLLAPAVVRGRLERRGSGVGLIPLLPFWLAAAGIAISLNRSALLALTMSLAVAMVFTWGRRSSGLILVTAAFIGFVGLFSPALDTDHRRDVSVEQVVRNAVSLVSPSAAPELSGTSQWRKEWWGEIVDYTIHGPYFWTGKGFGVNLADDDGFQVTRDGSLRSPHNGHLTILARMGVPGFAIWSALQIGFGLALWRALLRARRNTDAFWFRINLWLLCYWIAMIVNMTFDVYLEGPQGGIWFWSIFGLGMAAVAAQREDLGQRAHPPRP